MIGLSLEEIFSKLAPGARTNKIQEIITSYRKICHSIALKNTALFPGMRETLEALHDWKKTLAIATRKNREGVELMLDELKIHHLFFMVVTAEQVARKKPAPDMVKKILLETQTQSCQALLVGDTVYDIQMGKNAGVKTCAVTYGA